MNAAIEEFIEHGGGEVVPQTNPWEVVRFKTVRGTHVVYKNAKGKYSYSDKHAEQAHKAFMGKKPWMAAEKVQRRGMRYLIISIKKRDGEGCFYCPKPFTEDDRPTIEHLLALGCGGNNTIANLALAHESCNKEADCLSVAEKVRIRERNYRSAS